MSEYILVRFTRDVPMRWGKVTKAGETRIWSTNERSCGGKYIAAIDADVTYFSMHGSPCPTDAVELIDSGSFICCLAGEITMARGFDPMPHGGMQ